MIMSLKQKKTKFIPKVKLNRSMYVSKGVLVINLLYVEGSGIIISTPLSASHLMSLTAVDFKSYNALVCYITTHEIHVPGELSCKNLIS